MLPDLWRSPTLVTSVLPATVAGISPARGTSVTYCWSARSPVDFSVEPCSPNGTGTSENGTEGSGTFVAQGGTHVLGVGCAEGPCAAATLWGIRTGPLLPN